jgi:hypothetical protein
LSCIWSWSNSTTSLTEARALAKSCAILPASPFGAVSCSSDQIRAVGEAGEKPDMRFDIGKEIRMPRLFLQASTIDSVEDACDLLPYAIDMIGKEMLCPVACDADGKSEHGLGDLTSHRFAVAVRDDHGSVPAWLPSG